MERFEFDRVLEEELRAIKTSRQLRGLAPIGHVPDRPAEHTSPHPDYQSFALDQNLFGLALSGGGIRSATFNLGVIQELADLELLHRIDYVSTVSGGGYIGSWLHGYIHRQDPPRDEDEGGHAGPRGVRQVEDELRHALTQDLEPFAIRHLRQFSNYLTPKKGLLGPDTWMMVSHYLGKLLLTQATLFGLFAALLAVPVLAAHVLETPQGGWASAWMTLAPLVLFLLVAITPTEIPKRDGGRWLLGLGIAVALSILEGVALHVLGAADRLWTLGVTALGATAATLCFVMAGIHVGRWVAKEPRGPRAAELGRAFLLPIYLGSICIGATLPFVSAYLDDGTWKLERIGVLWIAVGLFAAANWLFWRRILTKERKTPWAATVVLPRLRARFGYHLVALLAGGLAGLLFFALMTWSAQWSASGRLAFLPPACVMAVWTSFVLQTGIGGRIFDHFNLEWFSRVGAWLLLLSLGWVVVFGIAAFADDVVRWILDDGWRNAGALGAWLVPSGGAVLLARGAGTGGPDTSNRFRIILLVAPYVFALGLLLAIGYVLHLAAAQLNGGVPWLVGIGLAVAFLWRLIRGFDANVNSMHGLYRDRLVRCYLGASRKERAGDRFTNMDRLDDLALSGVARTDSYLPIVNATLNLTKGENLAWQDRKAASFTFTPHYVGYWTRKVRTEDGSERERGGFIPTDAYCGDKAFTLGAAMAVSGAAASPNMGYHSSPLLAFFLTCFNVRLGAWLPNPERQAELEPERRAGVRYLIKELTGSSSDRDGLVYVSDGGHFDNLGVYELVRRRCRFIVVCDAGADGGFDFDDLGRLVRTCRTDFGVRIEIDASQLHPDEDGRSQAHCAVGTIEYPRKQGDGAAYDPRRGILIYLKPTLIGDERADVLNYAARNQAFPHQSTGDQWFDESQFESYRRLGRHAAKSAIEPVWRRDIPIPELADALRHHWVAPPRAGSDRFAVHADTLTGLMRELREDPNLEFLTWQIYPEWKWLMGRADDVGTHWMRKPDDGWSWLPESQEERLAGFFFCHNLIQLMENVYLDLDLERELDHPDNRGWINLFRHWTWAGMFRVTWSIVAATFGARFQSFCKRHLDCRVQDIELVSTGYVFGDSFGPFEDKTARTPESESLRLLDLNEFEQEIVESLLRTNKHNENRLLASSPLTGTVVNHQIDVVVPFVAVENPILEGKFRFPVGFMLLVRELDEDDTPGPWGLAYLRIQDHLRQMGLGTRVMRELRTPSRAEHRAWRPTRVVTFQSETQPGLLVWPEGDPRKPAAWRDAQRGHSLIQRMFDAAEPTEQDAAGAFLRTPTVQPTVASARAFDRKSKAQLEAERPTSAPVREKRETERAVAPPAEVAKRAVKERSKKKAVKKARARKKTAKRKAAKKKTPRKKAAKKKGARKKTARKNAAKKKRARR